MPGQPGLRLILAAHTLGDPPLFPPARRTRQQRKSVRGRLPSLCGVLDRPAGHGPGFRYSTANIAAGLVWNLPTLDRSHCSATSVVPGKR